MQVLDEYYHHSTMQVKSRLELLMHEVGLVPSTEGLNLALTHRSTAVMNKNTEHYERLEFLGDSLLNAWFSKELFNLYPKDQDGVLSKMRAQAVSAEKLWELARMIGLWDAKKFDFSASSESQAKSIKKICAERLEAIVGCYFLEFSWKGVDHFLSSLLKSYKLEHLRPYLEREPLLEGDIKGLFQEYCHRMFKENPVYETLSISQNGQEACVEVRLMLQGKEWARVKASSNKMAHRLLAKEALDRLKNQSKDH